MIVKLKNTFQKLNIEKTHLILNIISIACGTFSIATMLAVGEGLRITFSKIVGDRGQNLLIIKPNHTGKHYRGVHANTIVKLNKKDFNNIVKTSSIISASPRYTVRHPIRYKENTAYSKTMAVNSDYKNIHSIQVEPGGRFINPIDIKESHSVIVLGEKTIEQLFKEEENPIEKTVTINHKKFIIIGVMKKKPLFFSSQTPEHYLNWIPYTTYELMMNPQIIDSISVVYEKSQKSIEEIQTGIRRTIALNHGFDPHDDSLLHFSNIEVRQEKVAHFFLGLQVFLGIIGSLTLFVSGIGIANVMYSSIRHSTYEIGIRMAVGARSVHILSDYFFKIFSVIVLGGGMGIFMSYCLVFFSRILPLKGKLIDIIGRPDPVLSIYVILIVSFILGLTGLFSGLFPSLKATKIDPIEALRYE